jgi:hypothetical protein
MHIVTTARFVASLCAPMRFHGGCTWTKKDGTIERGIVSDALVGTDRVSLDVTWPGGDHWSFQLRQRSEQWVGASRDAQLALTKVSARGDGCELSGPWKQDGEDWLFEAELDPK